MKIAFGGKKEVTGSSEVQMLYHVTSEQALPSIRQSGLLPKIGPRSKRLKESSPAIYFFRTKEMAFDAVCGWLGDIYPSKTKLVCLTVALPVETPLTSDPNFGEVEAVCKTPVPPEFIVEGEEV
jgi:hypothetical protein